MSTQTPDLQFSVAFNAIVTYAEAQKWIPIGFRTCTVGPWEITVNGTTERHADVEPYHALVVHQDVVAIMVLNPMGGSIGGWQGAEDQFIKDMAAATAALCEVRA